MTSILRAPLMAALLSVGTACGGGGAVEVDAGSAPSADSAPGAEASAGGLCPAYPGCGGDIVGSWRVLDYCHFYDNNEGTKECNWKVIGYMTATGTITFGADQIFSTDLVSTNQVTEYRPPSCPAASSPPPGEPATCEAVEREHRAAILAMRTYHPSATCTGTDRCVCDLGTLTGPDKRRGRYAVKGDIVDLDEEGPYYRFCVKGDELFINILSRGEGDSGSIRLRRQ